MKRNRIIFSLFISLFLFLISCERSDLEFGDSNIFFPNASPRLELLDTLSYERAASMTDTVIHYVTVYRSGVVNNLERIDVAITIDEDSVQTLISEAIDTDPLYRTDLMNSYVNALAATADMYTVPETVTIPEGQRSVVVPLTLKRAVIYPYRNDYLNYDIDDYHNPQIEKDKLLVAGIRITAVSHGEILDNQAFCFFEIVKACTFE